MRKLIVVIITLLIATSAFGQGWSSSIGGDVTLSGVAALYPRGTDGRPSIGVQQDTDTGIRFPAAGQISFILDGTRKVLFDTNGFVIGTNYLNFGTVAGTTGYGLRNNAGVVQFKDSGGSWINVAAASNGAPTSATYLLQTPNGGLSAEQALSTLATGILKVTTATGVVDSITDSAGIAANISDETGSGVLVFGTSPTLTTPTLAGVISGTPSVTGAWTFAAGSVGIRDTDNTHNLVLTPGSNLTANRIFRITTGDAERTLTVNADTTLDNWFDQDVRSSASPTFNALTVTSVTNTLSVFAATTSAQLAGVITNETGSGLLVFGTSPTLTTPVLGAATGTSLVLSGAATIGAALDLSGASAGQIVFPATPNYSANANTLDEYKESGTCSLILGGAGGTSGQTYTTQTCHYTKIGKRVTLEFKLVLSVEGTITGNLQLQGLPFTSAAGETGGVVFTYWVSLATNTDILGGLVDSSATTATIWYMAAPGGSMSHADATTTTQNGTEVAGSVSYLSAN